MLVINYKSVQKGVIALIKEEKENYAKITYSILSVMLLILVFVGFVLASVFYVPKTVAADTEKYTEIQRRLKDWGYYDGPITGQIDEPTKQAIIKFQNAHDISPTGNLDAQTSDALGVYVNTQTSNDLYLLAKCIFAESRGEPYVGKVAVGAVILNRVKSPDFPNSIYGVIYQPWAFTAGHDGQINLEPDNLAYQAAQDALNGWDPSYGSLYYYNPAKATSQWIFSRQTVVVIGDHIFAI